MAITDWATQPRAFIFNWFERERETDRHWFVVPLIYVFIAMCMCPVFRDWTPTTLAYRDDALTSWGIQPGAYSFFIKVATQHISFQCTTQGLIICIPYAVVTVSSVAICYCTVTAVSLLICPLLCIVFWWLTYFITRTLYFWIPFIFFFFRPSLTPFSLATISLFSVSMSLFLFCFFFYIPHISEIAYYLSSLVRLT